MKYLLALCSVLLVGCGEAPLFTACGLEVHDTRVSEEMACNSVYAVESAYELWGEDVNVIKALDKISIYNRDASDHDAGGYYEHGLFRQDKIVNDDDIDSDIEVIHVLVHEIVHVVQNNEENVPNTLVSSHACPWYGLDCGGMRSINILAYLLATDQPLDAVFHNE